MFKYSALLASLCILSCDGGTNSSKAISEDGDLKLGAEVRWYTHDQVTLGAKLFSENCAVCHGKEAEGTVSDWKQRMDNGSFPPPPLNGTAHAWHHPTSMLLQVINEGGGAYGGMMPAFSGILENSETLAVIAYFQNFWTDEIYGRWELMGGTN